ncbi:ABC transporter ATP-binding protein [Haloimpatiens sp. FM7330]|uniref:ABC transporter ATP-binding protein n=1 Tax=Haloimpatiens sp. FM7330 TaxID=3298610 RepID=UPI00362F5AC1
MFLKSENLCKSYKTGDVVTHVLKDVNISIEKGEIAAILGPSGSGKSTFLNIIGGIDRQDSGKVVIDGVEISNMSDKELVEYRRNEVGFIFQFYNLVPNLTVKENIEVAVNISKNPLSIDDVLKAVSMEDKKYRFPRELSGGEQQRVSIARAIVKNPKLLLCDEPTGALDYETSLDILKLIENINKKFKTTILIITHNTALSAMASKIFKLRSGEVADQIENKNVMPAERIEW